MPKERGTHAGPDRAGLLGTSRAQDLCLRTTCATSARVCVGVRTRVPTMAWQELDLQCRSFAHVGLDGTAGLRPGVFSAPPPPATEPSTQLLGGVWEAGCSWCTFPWARTPFAYILI